jgi:hypothetical protein
LKEKVAASIKKTDNTTVGICCADHTTPLYPQKFALTSSTGGGRSVGIILSRTKATELLSGEVAKPGVDNGKRKNYLNFKMLSC